MKFVIFLLTLFVHSSFQGTLNKVKVTIYYEALCQDSRRFIIDQLYPAYSQIGSHLLIDFVPYGKATHTLVNGEWIFRCQHGEPECVGNKFQACGLEFKNCQDKELDYIYCLSSSSNASSVDALNTCAPKLEVPAKDILECAQSKQGDELLAKYGDRTHSVQPLITFVPTIFFDDEFEFDLQELALKNFLEATCAVLNNKPLPCKSFVGKKNE